MTTLLYKARSLSLLAFVCFASCQWAPRQAPSSQATRPFQSPAKVPEKKIPAQPKKSQPLPLTTQKPPAAIHPPRIQTVQSLGLKLVLVTFDQRSHHLEVIDKPKGLQSSPHTSAQAAQSFGGIAAINGGFFDPQGEPLGKVRASQGLSGSWNANSSLTSGVYLSQIKKGARLVRQKQANQKALRLLQTGPFLVEKGKTISGLNNHRSRPRSFLIWDGKNRWALGYCSSASLAELSKSLQQVPFEVFPIQEALNLDGGRSSDLWASSKLSGGGVNTRQIWNKQVRNYLVLKPN